jgi:hypothetical protein
MKGVKRRLEISKNKEKKCLCTIYKNTVMLRKRIVNPLIKANEEYNSNLLVEVEMCLLFKAKMVMRKLFGIGIGGRGSGLPNPVLGSARV